MYKSKLHFFYTLFTKIFIFVHSMLSLTSASQHFAYICIHLLRLLHAHDATLLRFPTLNSTPFTQVLIKTRTVWWQMSPGQFRQSFPVPRFGQPLTSLFILAEFLSWKVSNYKFVKNALQMYYKCLSSSWTSIFLCISSLPPLRSSCPWRQSNLPLASGSQGSLICDI